MSLPSSRRQRGQRFSLPLAIGVLITACALISLLLAGLEALTPLKPISAALTRVLHGPQSAEGESLTAALAATYTPTITPIPPTATPAPPTPTPTLLPSFTPTPTPLPPTDTPAPTATPTLETPPTATPTPSPAPPSPTPTPRPVTPTQTPTRAAATATPTGPTPTPRPRATATPRAAALSGRVAFPVYSAGSQTYDVYVANIDGSNLVRVMDQASQPSLSPNGSRIAFRRWKADERGVFAMDTFGGNLQRRSEYLEDGPSTWSPDGGVVVFSSRRESDRQSRLYRFSAFDLSAATVMQQGPAAVYGETPAFLPDGRLLYKSNYPQMGLVVANDDGSNPVLIVGDETATNPSASATGLIAFMSRRDGNWELYRTAADGSGLLRLTQNGANDGLPAWSPDGRSLAFVSDRSGQWALWVMNADGSNQRQLFALPGPIAGAIPGEPDFVWRGWTEERISWR